MEIITKSTKKSNLSFLSKDGGYREVIKYGNLESPLVKEFIDLMSGKFKIVLSLSNIKANIYVSGKKCITRSNKFKKVRIWEGCKILKGQALPSGGSNSWPHATFKNGTCVIEVTTDGFPRINTHNYEMDIEIISIEKIK